MQKGIVNTKMLCLMIGFIGIISMFVLFRYGIIYIDVYNLEFERVTGYYLDVYNMIFLDNSVSYYTPGALVCFIFLIIASFLYLVVFISYIFKKAGGFTTFYRY